MDDEKLKSLLRGALNSPEMDIGPGVVSEFSGAPVDLFEDLLETEKAIAIAAFVAAAGATQFADPNAPTTEKTEMAFLSPTLREDRTRIGIAAARAALIRIPDEQRSPSLIVFLEACGCNPIPDLP